MLFLVISTPRPERPSTVRDVRRGFWDWMQPLLASGMARSCYARTGRGAIAVFDVDANETLHRLLNEWAEQIPAEFAIYPLIDDAAATSFLQA